MALSSDEITLLERHHRIFDDQQATDEKLERYFNGNQRIEQLGMAVPPAFRRFLVIANWCGVQVEALESRSDVRALVLPGQETADPQLQEIWDANNLDADLSLFLTDRYVYGRAFMSVGSNEEVDGSPLIHVESPRQMTALIDERQRRMLSAAKFYGSTDTDDGPTDATLYLPDRTVWVRKDVQSQRWSEIDRDVHNLGRVPVTMSLCRRRSGSFIGRSVMDKLMDLTDSCARALTNMQFASEAHGIPQRYALGVSQGDFVDKAGNPLPAWEAYFNAVWANKNPDIKVGQFSASDLKNFETQITLYGKLAASTTGLPSRYFGLTTTNPPSADAIRAEESQMVKFVERQNAQVGSVLGWTAALALRFANGEWVDGSRVGVEWADPATPTIAQREDALVKRYQAGVISREGYWDELGWSEPRKSKERQYIAQEAEDPVLQRLMRDVQGDAPVVN